MKSSKKPASDDFNGQLRSLKMKLQKMSKLSEAEVYLVTFRGDRFYHYKRQCMPTVAARTPLTPAMRRALKERFLKQRNSVLQDVQDFRIGCEVDVFVLVLRNYRPYRMYSKVAPDTCVNGSLRPDAMNIGIIEPSGELGTHTFDSYFFDSALFQQTSPAFNVGYGSPILAQPTVYDLAENPAENHFFSQSGIAARAERPSPVNTSEEINRRLAHLEETLAKTVQKLEQLHEWSMLHSAITNNLQLKENGFAPFIKAFEQVLPLPFRVTEGRSRRGGCNLSTPPANFNMQQGQMLCV